MKSLPPLASLQAFEAAARLGSFSRAATERHLTHSAISRHVQTLEHWCGAALFEHHGPRIALTDAGHVLATRLAEPLQSLHHALRSPTAQHAMPLRILTLPSLASGWLLPQLADFQEHHPHIELSIQTDYAMQSLPPHQATVALRYGTFKRDGLSCELLFNERLLAAATPAWFIQFGHRPADWPSVQMLRHRDTPWPQQLHGMARAKYRTPVASGMEFNDASLLMQAASAGLGVAWLRAGLARLQLQLGKL